MGFLSGLKEHFLRRVVNDNRGFLSAILPMLGKIAGSTAGQAGIMGGLSALFGGGQGEDIKLEDQRTPEQLQMAKMLQSLASTGSGGGINLGEAYGGSLGNFDLSGQEQSGLASLFGQQPTNAALSQAQDVYSKMAGAAFDPSVLDPFTKAARKSGLEANDILNRESAISGSRFGTGILQRKGELSADVESGIQQELSKLFLNQQNVSMQGAAGLAGVGGQQANMAQNNLQNMFTYGSLQRDLKNQEAQAKYNEFNRQRNETLGRVDLMNQEASRNPYLEVSSIPGSPSGFSSLINSVLGGAGEDIGKNILSSWSSGGLKGLFGLG